MNKYQVFIDLCSMSDADNEDMKSDSFIVSAKTAADAEGAAWNYIERSGLYEEYQEVYLWDITEDDRVD